MTDFPKLYVITRSDLLPGARAAQSVHAALAFAHEHPDVEAPWHEASNNLVLLEVPDEAALLALGEAAKRRGVACSLFTEPDLNDALTAIALGPEGRPLVSCLPLTLRLASSGRRAQPPSQPSDQNMKLGALSL